MAALTDANVTLCDPSDLTAYLTQEEIDFFLEPFDTTVSGVPEQRDVEMKSEEVDIFIEGQKKKNTKACTARDIKNVQRWQWEMKREPKAIENIQAEWLNDYLAEMFISIRKSDGSNYEPNSLESLKNSVERHLKDNGCTHSLRDRLFHKTQQALTAKKMSLKKEGKSRKANASEPISTEDEEKLFEANQLGIKTPRSLQFSVFYYLGKLFGFRGRDEQRKLKYGDVVIKAAGDGKEYLEFHERDSKTMDGSGRDDFRSTVPWIFSAEGPPEKDPVTVFKEFCRRRPVQMTAPESPMYLTPIPDQRLHETSLYWYYPRPMGINTLGSLMKSAAEKAGLDNKITNHSIRKTTVSTLSKAGVPPTKIMQITGHRNISSITSYDSKLSLNEQKGFSKILTGGSSAIPCNTVSINECKTSSESRVQETAARPDFSNLFSGASFNNCTFNFSC